MAGLICCSDNGHMGPAFNMRGKVPLYSLVVSIARQTMTWVHSRNSVETVKSSPDVLRCKGKRAKPCSIETFRRGRESGPKCDFVIACFCVSVSSMCSGVDFSSKSCNVCFRPVNFQFLRKSCTKCSFATGEPSPFSGSLA